MSSEKRLYGVGISFEREPFIQIDFQSTARPTHPCCGADTGAAYSLGHLINDEPLKHTFSYWIANGLAAQHRAFARGALDGLLLKENGYLGKLVAAAAQREITSDWMMPELVEAADEQQRRDLRSGARSTPIATWFGYETNTYLVTRTLGGLIGLHEEYGDVASLRDVTAQGGAIDLRPKGQRWEFSRIALGEPRFPEFTDLYRKVAQTL